MQGQQPDPDATGTGVAGIDVMPVTAVPIWSAPFDAPAVATAAVADPEPTRAHALFSVAAGVMAAAGGLALVLLAGARSSAPPEHLTELELPGIAAAAGPAVAERLHRPAGIPFIPIEPDRLDDHAAASPLSAGAAAARQAAPGRAANTAAAAVAPALDPERLIARGDQFLADADVVSARLFYRLAARIGSARAALAMAESFDSAALARHGVLGVRPDPEEALRWYRSAVTIGAEPTARAALAMSEQHPEGQAGFGR